MGSPMNCRTAAVSISPKPSGPKPPSLTLAVANWHTEVVALVALLLIPAILRLAICALFCSAAETIPFLALFLFCLVAVAIALHSLAAHPVIAKVVIALSLFQLSLTGMREIVPALFYSFRDIPLQDDAFTTADQVLGFSWVSYAKALLAIPCAPGALKAAYNSIFFIPIAICLSAIYSDNTRLLSTFILSMSFSLYFVVLLGAAFPCVGAYEHLGDAARSIPNMFGDRDGIGIALRLARTGAIDKELSTGIAIVQFPSYHACAGILFVLAGWKTPLRATTTLLSVLLIAATPIGGSHYLVDVVAGMVVGIASWITARLFLNRLTRFQLA